MSIAESGSNLFTSAMISRPASFSSAPVMALASRRLARKHISGVVGTRRRPATDHELLHQLEQVAIVLFGGHFTIMRFGRAARFYNAKRSP